MLLWIRNRKEAGQSFTFSEVCFENRDYALAIKREFGSWARALKSGVPSCRVIRRLARMPLKASKTDVYSSLKRKSSRMANKSALKTVNFAAKLLDNRIARWGNEFWW